MVHLLYYKLSSNKLQPIPQNLLKLRIVRVHSTLTNLHSLFYCYLITLLKFRFSPYLLRPDPGGRRDGKWESDTLHPSKDLSSFPYTLYSMYSSMFLGTMVEMLLAHVICELRYQVPDLLQQSP